MINFEILSKLNENPVNPSTQALSLAQSSLRLLVEHDVGDFFHMAGTELQPLVFRVLELFQEDKFAPFDQLFQLAVEVHAVVCRRVQVDVSDCEGNVASRTQALQELFIAGVREVAFDHTRGTDDKIDATGSYFLFIQEYLGKGI